MLLRMEDYAGAATMGVWKPTLLLPESSVLFLSYLPKILRDPNSSTTLLMSLIRKSFLMQPRKMTPLHLKLSKKREKRWVNTLLIPLHYSVRQPYLFLE